MAVRLDGYGVTPTGFAKKRFDTILDELHSDISQGWGVNTRLNPQSFFNVLLTNYADKLRELWEVAEQNYFSMYPSSAENISLDRAAEFGGITREDARPTRYGGAVVTAGMLGAGIVHLFEYDGEYWQLLNPSPIPLIRKFGGAKRLMATFTTSGTFRDSIYDHRQSQRHIR